MSKRVKQVSIAALVVLAAMQLVRPARTNPSSDPGGAIDARLPNATQMHGVVNRACRDCHTNQTTWPWYSEVAPVSWLVIHDVVDGRRAVNFSEWATYEPSRQSKLLKDACEEVSNGEMPVRAYTWMHPGTKLTPQDIDAICAAARALAAD